MSPQGKAPARIGLQVTVGVAARNGELSRACQSLLMPLDAPAARLSPEELRDLAGVRPFGALTSAADISVGLRAKIAPVEDWVPLNVARPLEARADSQMSRHRRRAAARARGEAHLRLTIAVLSEVMADESEAVVTIELNELESRLTSEERAAMRTLQTLTVVAGDGEALVLVTLAYEAAPEGVFVALPLQLRPVT